MNRNNPERQTLETHVFKPNAANLLDKPLGRGKLSNPVEQILIGEASPPVAIHPMTGMQTDM